MKRFVVLSCVVLSAVVATAAAQNRAAPRLYVMSEICTPETLAADAYPERAAQRLAMGDGAIDCILNAAHEPQICQIVRESSPGWGWGEAAVRASCQFSTYTWTRATHSNARNYIDANGVEHAERMVRFHVEGGWRPEERRY